MEEGTLDTSAVRTLLRESAADSIVLLKNDKNILPHSVKPGQTIAVIGPNASVAFIAGGGSASLRPTYKVTPLEAMEKVVKDLGAEIQYTIGALETRWTPLLGHMVADMRGMAGFMTADFFTSEYVGSSGID